MSKKSDKKNKIKNIKLEKSEIANKTEKRKNLKFFAIIFILGFVLYSNTLGNGYALDDKAMIYKNQYTQKGISGIKEILSGDSFEGLFGKSASLEGGRYRPLSLITFAIEIEFFGKKITDNITNETYIGCPTISHFINILLYCFSLLLLYVVLKKLFKNYQSKSEYFSIAFIATILFAFHPLHTEVVANIKGRDEILALLFVLLSFNEILKYIDTNKIYKLLLSAIYMFLGLLSKETIITFFAIIPLSTYFFRERKEFFKSLWGLVPITIGILCYLFVRHQAVGNSLGIEVTNLMNNPFYEMSISERYATIFYTLLLYLKLIFFPHPLTWDYYPYHIEILNFSNIWVIISLIIHLALLTIAILGLKRKHIISYSIFFYGITLSITSNIFFSVGAFMNERFVYISLLGFCIIIAYLLSEKLPKLLKTEKIYKSISITTITIILLLFSLKVISRNKDWENSFTLFQHDVKISKNSAKGNCSYAGELYRLADNAEMAKDTAKRNKYLLEAKTYFEKAIEIYPRYEEALVSYGNIYYKMYNDHETMFKYYIQALEVNPLHKDVWDNTVGVLTQNLNIPEYEKKIWEKYSEISDYYMSFFQLGELYLAENKNDSAIYYYEKAKIRNKYDFKLLKNLGKAYGNISNFNKAQETLLEAVKIQADAECYKMLGLTYGIGNDNQKALEYFEKAQKLDPQNQEYINYIMIARKNLGL